MISSNSNNKIIHILDKIIFSCLILYSLTFLLDIKINFLTTAFAFGIIKLIFIRPKFHINSSIFYIIFLFIICTSLSIFFNDITSISNNNFSAFKSRFISPLIGIFIILLFNFEKKHIIALLSCFSFSLLINAIFIIYQFSQGLSGRLVGLASGYMLLCAMNILILPIIFSLALYKSSLSNKLRLFYLITILINIPAIIFENTRIVWIALSITYFIIILVSLKNKKLIFPLLATVVLCCSIFFQNSPQSFDRLTSITNLSYQNQSNYERLLMWQSATNMFIEHPLFGVGVGNYHEQYITNYRFPYSREDQWHPHNVPLAMFSETGLIGGTSYVFLFVYLYYSAISTYLKTKSISSFAYLMCLLAYSINCLTDSMFCGHNIKSSTTFFWLFTGFYLISNKYVIISYNKKDLSK